MTRGSDFLEQFRERGGRLTRGHRGFRLERAETSPLRPGESPDIHAQVQLARVLSDQGVSISEIVVLRRKMSDDTFASEREQRRNALFGPQDRSPEGRLMVAGVRLEDDPQWLVARVRMRHGQEELIRPLLLQTLTIYLVLVGAVALAMRRITRPLAALTRRVEQFAETRDAEGQIEPQGPDDVRQLIAAHNALESRIAALLGEKDVMLGAIGHDLKTPLAALRVRIESVPDETERSKMAGTIEDIVRSLDDILLLARVGRHSGDSERTELSALVSSIVEEYEDMGQPVHLGQTTRMVVHLRPTWLRRALRNLIDNAVRYGASGRVSLEQEPGRALIRIEDDGPGIADNAIQTMMDPFTRGEPSRNSSTGGAGLGLTLARAIAEQHGGTLTLANRKSADGTVIGLAATLELPIT